MPLVSVGLPVYNGEQFIEQSIRSILDQTAADLELIISDNASTDRTLEIVEALAATDTRIVVVANEVNRGAAWNYNTAFERSTGEFFRWQAHDDWIEPTMHERLIDALRSDPDAILAHSWTRMVDDDGALVRYYEDDLHATSLRPADRLGSVVRRLTYCNAVFGLAPRARLAETALIAPFPGSDVPLLYELAMRGRFVVVPEHLFVRRPGNSVKSNPSRRQLTQWFDPAARFGRPPSLNIWRSSVSAIMRSGASWTDRAAMIATFHAVWPVEYVRRARRRSRRFRDV